MPGMSKKRRAVQNAEVDQYASLYQQFQWLVPQRFNISTVCCTRWARRPERVAIHVDDRTGKARSVSYAELDRDANRLANALQALGIARGDRVAIVLPQCPETVVAHMAIYRMGAVAMPLSMLFGPEALRYRLDDSGARAAIVAGQSLEAIRDARGECLATIIMVDDNDGPHLRAGRGETRWLDLLGRANESFRTVGTLADEPALLIYTSGTTGPPKGALMPHRALIGNLTGFVASQNWFPRTDDVFWSPADWAWTGGLMDALLPTLYFGRPIVASSGRFSPEHAFELLERHSVSNAFLFPTALKMMMKAHAEPRTQHRLKLRAIMSAGESVGATLFDWSREALGVAINEMFGQTEINYIVGNSAHRWPARAGSIGRPYPGHQVRLIDDEGLPVPTGETGEIAVNRFDIHGHPDPVFFLGYWKRPDATDSKFAGDWCRTGDQAAADEQGYLWYRGRADDMFKAAGYRIGPGEVENCLIGHPAVANAAVVPRPDPERGNLVKAYVVLAPGHLPGPALCDELQAHVRGRLAPYEYPKHIEFIDELPMTTTGKVQRRVLRLREQAQVDLLQSAAPKAN